jgi:hypothetical protein
VLLAAAVVLCDVAAGAIAGGALKSGDRVDLVAGFGATGYQPSRPLLSPQAIAVCLGAALALVALMWPRLRRALWLPAALAIGGGTATVMDVVADGRVNSWLDPPILAPLTLAEVALIAAALLLVYELGVALGGGGSDGPGAGSGKSRGVDRASRDRPLTPHESIR